MKNIINNKRLIEKYILKELSEKKRRDVEQALKENEELKKEIEKLNEEDISFYERYPTEKAVEKIYGRIHNKLNNKRITAKKRPGFFKVFLYASPALAAVAILLALNISLFVNNKPTGMGQVEGDREKGLNGYDHLKSYLVVMRESKGIVNFLKNGDSAKEGDIIQLAYVSKSDLYGIIFSIDGNGKITLHFPEDENHSTILKIGKRVRLPSAFLLDDAPEFEHFFFLTSQEEIDVNQILKKLGNYIKNLPNLKDREFKLDSKLNQFSILINKGE